MFFYFRKQLGVREYQIQTILRTASDEPFKLLQKSGNLMSYLSHPRRRWSIFRRNARKLARKMNLLLENTYPYYKVSIKTQANPLIYTHDLHNFRKCFIGSWQSPSPFFVIHIRKIYYKGNEKWKPCMSSSHDWTSQGDELILVWGRRKQQS